MKNKKWPQWLKNGTKVAIIGTPIFAILAEEFSNTAFVPWYAVWFVNIAIGIFGFICIVFRIDFISDAASKFDLIAASFIWYFSIFVTFFIVGAFGTIIINYAKKWKHHD